ncbi:MAG TPA: glycoside hydrolase family 3 N-terminal domain-containing protein, partial [Puia sp.]
MKRLLLPLAGILFALSSVAQSAGSDHQKAVNLVRQMTLDEKVGQMTQVTLGVVSKPQDGVLDPAALSRVVTDHYIGSILNVTNHALTVDQWHTVIRQIQDEAKKTRLKIPVIYGLDGIHGQTYTLDATLFPQNIGMAATRNKELA